MFGLLPSVGFVVGTVVGTGIYLKPGLLAGLLHRPNQIVLVWLLGGVFAFCGARVYTHLAANWPENGGAYLYLRSTYGKWAASLLLAADIFLGRPAAVGALATGLGLVWGLGRGSGLWLAAATVALFTFIQLLGSRVQGWSQAGLTALQLVPLLAALMFGRGAEPSAVSASWAVSTGEVRWAAAFLAVMWAYDGWYNITILAGEVKEPSKTIPRALLGGMGFVTMLYVLLNVALCNRVSREQLMEAPIGLILLWGESSWLGLATQCALTLAMLATLNGTLACGARMIVAGREDGLISERVGEKPTSVVPTVAFSLWCLGLLAVFGGLPPERSLFDSLSEFTAVVVTLLSALTVTCVFHRRLFSVTASWGVLAAALFYLGVTGILLYLLMVESIGVALIGAFAVLLLGSLMWLIRRKDPRPQGEREL